MKKLLKKLAPVILSMLLMTACKDNVVHFMDMSSEGMTKEGVTSGEALFKSSEEDITTTEKETETTTETTTTEEETTQAFILPEGENITERFAVPEGYERVSYPDGSFGSFVRNYPLKPDQSPVLLWTGQERAGQLGHAAVFDMLLEDEMDVQQCADCVMRIYAEYFRKTGQYDRIKFHFVGGFLCSYSKYIEGYRVKQNGDDFSWRLTKQPEDSEEVFNDYMFIVCAYSSTLSLKEESEQIELKDLKIGDIFLKAGSPGHVVMVADICEKDGKKAFLLAQGYMPAQDFHIVKNPRHDNDPWYYEDEVEYPFKTQGYTFSEGSLRRLNY